MSSKQEVQGRQLIVNHHDLSPSLLLITGTKLNTYLSTLLSNLFLIGVFLLLPTVAIANDLACKGLDKIEKNLPILHQPSEQVRTGLI